MEKQIKQLLKASTEVLEQVLSVIETSKDLGYEEVAEGMTSSVGCHLRHVFDHYIALQKGLAISEIDYDLRSRGSKVETCPVSAREYVLELLDWLEKNITEDVKLNIRTEVSVLNKEQMLIESSLKRELVYILSHTVHHIAQMSLALRILGVTVDEHIGIAPATATYLRTVNR